MCLGIPAQIVEIVDSEGGLAKAEISGVRRAVSIALCPEAGVGDWVLVHVGFALERIDEQQARETIELLEQMGEAYEQEVREIRASARSMTLDADRCITCGDVAVTATVVHVDGSLAVVDAGGAHRAGRDRARRAGAWSVTCFSAMRASRSRR